MAAAGMVEIRPHKDYSRDALLHEIKTIVHRFDPDADVILYGSRARGDWEPDSDWDVLVLLEKEETPELKEALRKAIYELELESGEVITAFTDTKENWQTPLMKATPYHWEVTKDGIYL